MNMVINRTISTILLMNILVSLLIGFVHGISDGMNIIISKFSVGGLIMQARNNQFVDSTGLMSINDQNHAPVPPATATTALCLVVRRYGYPCQEYNVVTEDGYVLTMQRIEHGHDTDLELNRSSSSRSINNVVRQPVLLQHGVLMDGMTWVLNPPDQSLAFILADRGYDVWISNTRGTRWSRRHISIQPNTKEYWSWSWDELVKYDLPAFADFVHDQTGKQLHYVGHSLGTLVALASFSEGKMVDKLKSAAFLSPIAYLSHMTTILGQLTAKAFVGEITSLLGIAEFNPKSEFVGSFLDKFCAQQGVNCYDLMTSFTGKNCCLNSSTVAFFLKNEPQPTSTKNMIHLAQTVRDQKLRMYDYGNIFANMGHYAQMEPPAYNLSNIRSDLPLFLSYGGQDALSDVSDVGLLLDAIKMHRNDKLTIQFIEDYAHADYVMAVNAKEVVYNSLLVFFGRQY